MDENDEARMTGEIGRQRGGIIACAVLVENAIDQIITTHFVGHNIDRQMEFMHVIFGATRMTFDNKIKILKYILKTYYSELYEKSEGFGNRIKEIMETRNAYAHKMFYPRKYENETDDSNWMLYSYTTNDSKLFESGTKASKADYERYLKEMVLMEVQLNEVIELQQKRVKDRRSQL